MLDWRALARRLVSDRWRFYVKRVLRRGSAHRCPLCRSAIKSYIEKRSQLPVVEVRQVISAGFEGVRFCPVCGGADRTRLSYLYLSRVELPNRSLPVSMLHFAPDFGAWRGFSTLEGVDYSACDIDPGRYRSVPNVREADITSLPYADEEFDIIICSHVLEHVTDDAKALAELYRIMKPGGLGLFQVPYANDGGKTDEDPLIVDPAERELRFAQYDHLRLYSIEDFVRRLEFAGFGVSLFNPFKEDPALAEDYGLHPIELLPVCVKARAEPSGAGSSVG